MWSPVLVADISGMVEATGSEPRKGKIQRHGGVSISTSETRNTLEIIDDQWSMPLFNWYLFIIVTRFTSYTSWDHLLILIFWSDCLQTSKRRAASCNVLRYQKVIPLVSSMILRSQGADRRSQITNDNSSNILSVFQSDSKWVQVRFSLTHTNGFELYRSLLSWM